MIKSFNSRNVTRFLFLLSVSLMSLIFIFSTRASAANIDLTSYTAKNLLVETRVDAIKKVKLSTANPALPAGSSNPKIDVSALTPMQVNHGSHWSVRKITYKFVGMSGKYKSAYNYAIKSWNNVHVVKFVSSGSEKPDIYLRQKSLKILGDYSSGKNVIGLTYTSYYKSSDTLVKGATSYLLTDNIKKFHITNGNLRRTAIHELGHAIGMKHNSKRPSIMYPYISNKISISSGDVKALYNTYHNLSY
ncbi:matrixin family metalloprotease [Secundilactobacillus malefermentans]|nr:matrixin family metalloprotease [Secundilactobacillus malefermentans]QEA30933.1 matrixin family metalloprotease [Secundilactobacillus malefermentans]